MYIYICFICFSIVDYEYVHGHVTDMFTNMFTRRGMELWRCHDSDEPDIFASPPAPFETSAQAHHTTPRKQDRTRLRKCIYTWLQACLKQNDTYVYTSFT